MESSTTHLNEMQQELNNVVARMQSDLTEYGKLAENDADAARTFYNKMLAKAQLLVPKKEETEALVDQSSESRKRKRDEEEDQPEKEVMKQVIVKVHVPSEKMRFVAGKQFSNKDRLESKYKVRVHIPQRGGEEVELKGPAHRVAAAKEDILANLPADQTHVVPKKFIGSIIGRNGEKINELRRRHKVRIDVKFDNEVTISGAKERCDDAWSDIKAILNRCKRDEEDRKSRDDEWYLEWTVLSLYNYEMNEWNELYEMNEKKNQIVLT